VPDDAAADTLSRRGMPQLAAGDSQAAWQVIRVPEQRTI
jgi:hypothetical protein